MSKMQEILEYAARFRERVGGKRTFPGSTYPMVSDAAGINPDQIKEQMQADRELGVPTEYTRDGQAVFNDARHRRAYCEAHGLYDRNGGYGDPQRGGRN